MILHLNFEIPKPKPNLLDHESADLTDTEIGILRKQIRKNSVLIDQFISRLDLLVNQERYPKALVFIQKIRRRLELLIEENDTFRGVLWKHYQKLDLLKGCGVP